MNKSKHLDLASIKRVRDIFQRATVGYQCFIEYRKPEEDNEGEEEFLKSIIIRFFSSSYELSWKFMERWLSMNGAPDIVDGVSRRTLFKIAAENKLIDDVEQWMIFHETKNSIYQPYDSALYNKILPIAMQFTPYLNSLVKRLE